MPALHHVSHLTEDGPSASPPKVPPSIVAISAIVLLGMSGMLCVSFYIFSYVPPALLCLLVAGSWKSSAARVIASARQRLGILQVQNIWLVQHLFPTGHGTSHSESASDGQRFNMVRAPERRHHVPANVPTNAPQDNTITPDTTPAADTDGVGLSVSYLYDRCCI